MLSGRRAVCLKRIFHQVCVAHYGGSEAEKLEMEAKCCLEKIFDEAVNAVLPQKLVAKSLKIECNNLILGHKWYALKRNVHLVGFGKAVLGMAVAAEKALKQHLVSGVICVPEFPVEFFKNRPEFRLQENSVIEVYEGAHGNKPDEKAVKGAEAIIQKVKSLKKSDILLVLISGGGSALLPKPREGLTLEDKLLAIELLRKEGASINELNTVRKQLSEVKGGGLAIMSSPVTTIALILSDIVHDPMDLIASGPTVANLDKPNAAFDVLNKYNLCDKVPESVLEISKRNFRDPCFPISAKGYFHVDNFIIGNNLLAVQEAKVCAEKLGFRTILLTHLIDSPINTIGDFYVNLSYEICKALYTNEIDNFMSRVNYLLKMCQYDFPRGLAEDLLDCMKLRGFCKGICIIAGGETTVKVRGTGVGGRNQELALLVACKLFKLKQANANYFKKYDVSFMSAGTDGIDGNSPAAGAVAGADIIDRALENYVDPNTYLRNNDSYSFFKLADKGAYLISPGHTGTNVMDLHILAIRDITSLGYC